MALNTRDLCFQVVHVCQSERCTSTKLLIMRIALNGHFSDYFRCIVVDFVVIVVVVLVRGVIRFLFFIISHTDSILVYFISSKKSLDSFHKAPIQLLFKTFHMRSYHSITTCSHLMKRGRNKNNTLVTTKKTHIYIERTLLLYNTQTKTHTLRKHSLVLFGVCMCISISIGHQSHN